LFLHLKEVIPNFLLKLLLPKDYYFVIKSDLKDFKKNFYLSEYNKINSLFNKRPNKINDYFSILNNYIFSQVEIKKYFDLTYMTGLFVENSHSLTIQGDLVGMKNSVEVRCPFLERKLIERAYNIPLTKKISLFNLKEGKKIIKKGLSKYLSRKFVYGKKVGFGTEMDKHEHIINYNYQEISEKITNLTNRDIFDKKNILILIKNKESIKDNFTLIMKLYALEIWFKYIKEIKNEHN
jgi:asparagine synthetase B (glutamine-hydrolysing)